MRHPGHREQCSLSELQRTLPKLLHCFPRHRIADLHERGIDVVVAQLNMRFKTSLRPGDKFEIRLALEKQGLRYVFHQDIVRLADEKRAQKDPSYQKEVLSLRAQTDIVAIINGRLSDCPELNEKFGL